MLEMRESCEKCAAVLGWQDECYICSYECTWCTDCTEEMNRTCPNCQGELLARPKRRPKS